MISLPFPQPTFPFSRCSFHEFHHFSLISKISWSWKKKRNSHFPRCENRRHCSGEIKCGKKGDGVSPLRFFCGELLDTELHTQVHVDRKKQFRQNWRSFFTGNMNKSAARKFHENMFHCRNGKTLFLLFSPHFSFPKKTTLFPTKDIFLPAKPETCTRLELSVWLAWQEEEDEEEVRGGGSGCMTTHTDGENKN